MQKAKVEEYPRPVIHKDGEDPVVLHHACGVRDIPALPRPPFFEGPSDTQLLGLAAALVNDLIEDRRVLVVVLVKAAVLFVKVTLRVGVGFLLRAGVGFLSLSDS